MGEKKALSSVKVSLVHVLNLTSDCIRSVNFFLKLRVWTPCQGYISVIDCGKLLRVWKSEFSMCFFFFMRDKSEIQSSFCPIKGKNYAGACSQVVRPIAQVFHDIKRGRGKKKGGK